MNRRVGLQRPAEKCFGTDGILVFELHKAPLRLWRTVICNDELQIIVEGPARRIFWLGMTRSIQAKNPVSSFIIPVGTMRMLQIWRWSPMRIPRTYDSEASTAVKSPHLVLSRESFLERSEAASNRKAASASQHSAAAAAKVSAFASSQ